MMNYLKNLMDEIFQISFTKCTFWFFTSYLLWKFIFEPIIYAIYYKMKYGSKVYIHYFPVIGLLSKIDYSLKKYKDSFGFLRNKINKNPDIQFILSLNGMNKIMYFFEPK